MEATASCVVRDKQVWMSERRAEGGREEEGLQAAQVTTKTGREWGTFLLASFRSTFLPELIKNLSRFQGFQNNEFKHSRLGSIFQDLGKKKKKSSSGNTAQRWLSAALGRGMGSSHVGAGIRIWMNGCQWRRQEVSSTSSRADDFLPHFSFSFLPFHLPSRAH